MGRCQKWRQDRCNESVSSSSSWVTWVVDHDRPFTADPATNEELGTVPEMGLEETKEAIEAAHKAFPAWSRTTAKVCEHASFCPTHMLMFIVCSTAMMSS